MSDKRLFNLVHDEARRRAIVAVGEAPTGWRVTIEPPKRTLAQNDAIHPEIEAIAKDAGRPTDKASIKTLRYLLLEAWRNETGQQPMYERSLDGMRMVNVDGGTSDLNRPDCSDFIAWLRAWRDLHAG